MEELVRAVAASAQILPVATALAKKGGQNGHVHAVCCGTTSIGGCIEPHRRFLAVNREPAGNSPVSLSFDKGYIDRMPSVKLRQQGFPVGRSRLTAA